MTKQNISKKSSLMTKILDWAYAKAITGFGSVDSAYKLADEYLKEEGTLDQKIRKLIKWQSSKATVSGFLTGVGGFAIMPFLLPANVASVIYIQIRMITAIAHMGGYDIKNDRVKTMIFASMVGNGAKQILKDISVRAGEKALNSIARNATAKSLSMVNEHVGAKVFTKFSTKGFSKLGKAIPLMGGVIGGIYDGTSTRIIGMIAKRIFIDNEASETIIVDEDQLYPTVQ